MPSMGLEEDEGDVDEEEPSFFSKDLSLCKENIIEVKKKKKKR